ncbi:hypothetical protein GCM10011352_01370 [Marinobacterium zhoushanense]|uniref:DUF3995 domain-containing protein n=1 Tax=Marinobacterium zhoushanense TaxID=1679163 RepID=A0ABQ1JWJ3_9GAMM|nr:hypothetical protein [Marinobacterium zhoushanense]GGB79448.1 hypothetical protein GCM10011352_01370 [Marinobacterium zhoushanense]
MYQRDKALIAAGILSLLAALLHIAVIFGGPDWYRFFGAGEEMALMAERGEIYPTILTLGICSVLVGWALYAFSGAKLIPRLPWLKVCLILITAVYCVRGTYGFFVPLVSSHPYVDSLGAGFWVWSSLICLAIGLVHAWGVRNSWAYLSHKRSSAAN